MHNLLCMTDKGSEYRHLSALLSTSPNRFSDVSICQGPNENMMRRIYGPRGRMEGWEGRGGEGRDGTRDGCRGRMKGEKIHSVLISGLRRGYIVLGAFYLDVAAAGVCLSLLFHSLSLFISAILIFPLYVCVCNQDKCVFFFVYILFFSFELPQAASPAFCLPRKMLLLRNHSNAPCFTPTFFCLLACLYFL